MVHYDAYWHKDGPFMGFDIRWARVCISTEYIFFLLISVI